MIPRYISDSETRAILAYCEHQATLLEKTVVTILLHTGIRAAELGSLKASDVVQIGGVWKLHIHQGKGLKDRLIPLTSRCREVLQAWQNEGWEHSNDFLFTKHGSPWTDATRSTAVCTIIRELGLKLGIIGLTLKADVMAAQIQRLELPSSGKPSGFIPMHAITVSTPRTATSRGQDEQRPSL